MFFRVRSIPNSPLLLVGLTAASSIVIFLLPFLGIRIDQSYTYVAQPLINAVLAGIAYYFVRGRGDRIRHKAEKALIVGSVIAIWFVAYFGSGVILTYQHNAVASSWQAMLVNVGILGSSAVALEYVRHSVMLLGGRRNILPLGVITTLVFALAQLNIMQFSAVHTPVDAIKSLVSVVLPSVASSTLLTYLASSAGLPAQLTYRLGVFASMYLPPIIPKYDWYLTGVVSMLLVAAVYGTIDRTRSSVEIKGRRYHHAHRAYDAMSLIMMAVLVMFMSGFFSYKPQAIMSDSMMPVYGRGSMVVVQKVSPMDVSVGDIVQYTMPGYMITHRVIRIDVKSDGSGDRVFTTKGDNSPSEDKPVGADQIVGVIRAQVPLIGYPSVWLKEAAQ